MAYRFTEIEVPEANPFQNDVLERRPLVEFLVRLISRVDCPFVLAIDSPWGTGKSTLVRMLKTELEKNEFSCIYFNAWQVDYVTDPLVALVSSINGLNLGSGQANKTFRKHFEKAKKVTTLVAKRSAIAAAKAITIGALDIDKEIESAAAELAGDSISDIVDAFQKEGELLLKFKDELAKAVEQLPNAGKKPTLVLFIDEIDRCRPTFAIELLERIKHLFDTPNILFVLSLDKKQLESSIGAVYGTGINSTEYLRRFIDLEYSIPPIKTKKFINSLLSRLQLDEFFSKRTHPDLRYDRSNFIDFFSTLADAANMSLRAQERCITRLRVVLDQTPNDHYLDPILIAVLIMLRTYKPDMYENLIRGIVSSSDVMAYFRELPSGELIFIDRTGIVIEAYLIATDVSQDRKDKVIAELQTASKDEKNAKHVYAKELLEMMQHVQRPMRGLPKLHQVAKKVDFAAGIQD